MTPARQADAELDALIEEITVDCYDEDEQLKASRTPSTRTPASHAPAPSSARTSRFYLSAQRATDAN